MGRRILTTEEIIIKANKIHNNRYTYFKCVYKNSKEKICITCQIHGDFWQISADHLKGRGCSKCAHDKIAKIQSMTMKEFFEKSRVIHNNYYTYFKCVYKKSTEKVCITCPVHGDFWQTPNGHLRGGCFKCGHITCSKKRKYTPKELLEKFNKLHDFRYTYSNIESYQNTKKHIQIICKKHGLFCQSVNEHLAGSGCPTCGNELTKIKLSSNLKEFIEKSNIIHNNKYLYTKSVYSNNKTKICITCKKHGDFYQIPNDHLRGSGCPKCLNSKGENLIMNFLNKNKIIFEKNKYFDGCVYKNKLLFDFFIPSLKLCIEFDGLQHFNPVERFGGEDALSKTIIRDCIKTKYCQENNIRLLRIKYTDIDNITVILQLELDVNRATCQK
jgi:hypothetical protein